MIYSVFQEETLKEVNVTREQATAMSWEDIERMSEWRERWRWAKAKVILHQTSDVVATRVLCELATYIDTVREESKAKP